MARMKPLSGILCIETASWHAGPVAGYMLGDLGASVVKIEPLTGDPMRGLRNYMGLPTALEGDSNPQHELANRSKRSIALNFKDPDGRALLHKMLDKADVYLTNMRPGGEAKLELDAHTLLERNPRLVIGRVTGYGSSGPVSDSRAFDTLALARSGIMLAIGEPSAKPQFLPFGIADQLTGTMLTSGVITALYAREKTGKGQVVEVSLYGTVLHALGIPLMVSLLTGQDIPQLDQRKMMNPLMGCYQCADHEWLLLSENSPDKMWPAFCRVLGLAGIQNDARFATMAARAQHREDLIAMLQRTFSCRPRDEWIDALLKERIACAPIQRIKEAGADPQAIANNYVIDFEHPTLGKTKMLGYPLNLSATPSEIAGPAPNHGQHTEEILLELCGCTWDDIERLRARGIIL